MYGSYEKFKSKSFNRTKFFIYFFESLIKFYQILLQKIGLLGVLIFSTHWVANVPHSSRMLQIKAKNIQCKRL